MFIRGRVDFWMKVCNSPRPSLACALNIELTSLSSTSLQDGSYSEDNAWSGRMVFGKNPEGEVKLAEYQVRPLSFRSRRRISETSILTFIPFLGLHDSWTALGYPSV